VHIAIIFGSSENTRDRRAMPILIPERASSTCNIARLWMYSTGKFVAIGVNSRIDNANSDPAPGCPGLIGRYRLMEAWPI